jgi:hypothetical protein
VEIPATSDNIPGTLVLRDASGNLSADTVAADVTGDLTGNVTGDITGNVTGNVTGDLTGNVTGNASTATALQTSRTIELTGDVTGSASFNGTANASISANISSGVIVDADIKSDAAIAGTKIAPTFASQILATSGVHWVGTVSQSGQSAVVEAGSNADGKYVRYAGGTQICWKTFTLESSFAFDQIFRSSTYQTWTFPVAFSEIPVVSGSRQGGATGVWASALLVTTTNCNLELMSSRSRVNQVINFSAVGLWH